jgi:hypothetical protein
VRARLAVVVVAELAAAVAPQQAARQQVLRLAPLRPVA